ncbi:MAG: hypothetical protein A2V66_11880 [Ignavibacteria bacterium RBG_13_36_8]|nr:MAG: hypothetical protein A2V66_11880 [Ignavibacteria bacterium RBG_13_36_8]
MTIEEKTKNKLLELAEDIKFAQEQRDNLIEENERLYEELIRLKQEYEYIKEYYIKGSKWNLHWLKKFLFIKQ